MTVKDAIAKEELYFSTHPVYSTMPRDYLGCGVLTGKLSKILFTHIKHNLPDIIAEIREKLRETQGELDDLGPPMPTNAGEKM